MRLSIILVIFFLLFNGWGGLMMEYDIDDHLGINAETGDAEELEQAREGARNVSTGEPTGQTLIGYYGQQLGSLTDMLAGLQPGVQLLVNTIPSGIGEDIVIWAFTILPILAAIDALYFARGGGL